MRIDRIRAKNLMKLDAIDVALPPRGVIIVLGVNGQGKSTLIEAVAAALWGNTLRGTRFWRTNTPCEVEVTTDRARVLRTVTANGSKALRFSTDGTEPKAEHGTTKAAQEALNAIIPPWDVFRRAHVFSSADASLFSTATDLERKQLLERVLGLERFERAVDACRKELRVAERAKEQHAFRLGQAETVVKERLRRLEDHAPPTVETGAREWAQEQASLSWLRSRHLMAEAAELRRAMERCDLEAYRTRADALSRDAHRARVEAIDASAGCCPMSFCRAPIDPTVGRDLRKKADALERAARAAADETQNASARIKRLEAELVALRVRYRALAEAVSRVDAVQDAWEVGEEKRAQAHQAVAQDVEGARVAVDACRVDLDAARAKLDTLAAVERVLGLRGVRSALLDDALAGLELLAQRLLARVFPELRLQVTPRTQGREKAVEAIALTVEGAGDGAGYHALSAGQRRRVDMALMLALAELSDGALGEDAGALFFDECFDALDEEGVAAFSDLVIELAETRQVFVVSHNPMLVSALLPQSVARFRVADGQVHERGILTMASA